MKLAERIFRRSDWYVTSPFGYRKSPISGKVTMHSGTDYGTHVSKWPQYALEEGKVLTAAKDSSGAKYCWVQYPRLGIELLHYHLDSVNVKKGQAVNKETILGYTGKTGKATGIHLHLAMRKIGSKTYLDPHAYDYAEYVAPVVKPSFNKGDVVVPTKLVNFTGVKLTQYDKTYVITSIHNDRAVLSARRNGKLIIWAAMNIKNIKKV